jgi:hypothetical protein
MEERLPVFHPHNLLILFQCILSNHGRNLAPLQGADNFLHKSLLSHQKILGISYNLSGESSIFEGYREVLKGIFIRLVTWLGKVNEPTDEVYER